MTVNPQDFSEREARLRGYWLVDYCCIKNQQLPELVERLQQLQDDLFVSRAISIVTSVTLIILFIVGYLI